MIDEKESLINQGEMKEKDSFLLPLLIALMVMMAALFIGELLFGKNSLEVYQNLKKDKNIISQKITNITNENAHLQKQYFELKGLMPSTEEDE
jgi:cell division protein FtsB